MKTEIKVDSEFKALIPPLQPEEREDLEHAILADGCLDSLKLWNSILLDGHNRLEICDRHKLPYKTSEVSLANRDDAILWIIDNQKGRRNLADIDRIALQLKRKDIVARMAKKKRKTTEGRPKLRAQLPSVPKVKVETRKILANAAGVGERTFDAGEMILKAVAAGQVSDQDMQAIRRKEKSIHRVAKDLKEERQAEKRKTNRKAAAANCTSMNKQVIVGDFRDHADKVPNGSLSLIFTDPPYNRKGLEMLPGLAEFAEQKLAEGGSLLCYVGQTKLPQAIIALQKSLRYWWTICCLHDGGKNLMREYGIRAGWKPILWFVKETRDDKEDIVIDVVSGGEEKDEHEWQQAESEAAYWIQHLTPKDGIVCDPFLGSGTTAIAAISLKRKWIGFEIDPDTAKAATVRIGK